MSGNVYRQQCAKNASLSPCLFEYVYFARPDSILDGISVYQARYEGGNAERTLCSAPIVGSTWERPLPRRSESVSRTFVLTLSFPYGIVNNLVRSFISLLCAIKVPDTSRTAALQCAHILGIPYREGLTKNRYVGRTFIMPGMRKQAVRRKLNAMPSEFKGKNVLLVDGTDRKTKKKKKGGTNCHVTRRLDCARHDQQGDRRDGTRGRCRKGVLCLVLAADPLPERLRDRHAVVRRARGARQDRGRDRRVYGRRCRRLSRTHAFPMVGEFTFIFNRISRPCLMRALS